MAMPRYKYAIGNAPVRFPSAASQKSTKDEVAPQEAAPEHARPRNTSSTSQQHQQPRSGNTPTPDRRQSSERPNRWSLLSLVRGNGDLLEAPEHSAKQVKKTRSQQNLRSASGSSTLTASTSSDVDDEAGIRRSTSAQGISNEAERVRSVSLLDASTGGGGGSTKPVPSHARIKTAHAADASPQLRSSLASLRADDHAAKRVSWVMPLDGTSRGSSRASSIRGGIGDAESAVANEHTSLLSNASASREMSNRHSQQRPPSTSSTLRPSSLFWTDMSQVEQGAAGSKTAAAAAQVDTSRRGSSASARSYGATSPSQPARATSPTPPTNEDDPYGFRAMAGPVLLPLFHEQQRKASQAAASATRTCTPDVSSPWRWLSFVGLLALAAGITYFILL